MELAQGSSTVEELNEALRLYRRLLFRSIAIVILGFAACLGLNMVGTWLRPPYGIYVLGESLAIWGLIAVVVLLMAEVWLDGRRIGKFLADPVMTSMPLVGVLSGLTVIAQRAHAMGMTWSGFLGDLRPIREG